MDNLHRHSEMPRYLRDYYGAKARLSELRGAAAKHGYAHWKDARHWTWRNWHAAHAALSQGGAGEWYCHTGEQFRGECDAHELVRSLPRGWFTDVDCTDTAIGIVGRLPHGRFIVGYRWTSNDERVYYPDVYDDADEAARAADSHAERFAESAREDDELFQTMCSAEDHAESMELDTGMAVEARNVSARHRRVARDRIAELRAARADVETARAAYERG
jgi:hypothetical protein